MSIVGDEELVGVARAFLGAAHRVLEEQGVLPPSAFHPHIKVGRDYAGPDLMGLPEFRAFEDVIAKAHPRFSSDVPLGERDFANGYVFSFLEAYVARVAARRYPPPMSADAALEETLRDLASAVDTSSCEVACCRVVSHMTTTDGQALDIAGVRVVPIAVPPHNQAFETHDVINSVIPGAARAYAREEPYVFAPPESVVIMRGTGSEPFEDATRLSHRIERFLLCVRLLQAGTCESAYEVQGETCRVRRLDPVLVRFRGAGPGFGSPTSMVRRTVRLGAEDSPRLAGIAALLEAALQERPGMVFTSFAMAVRKFQLSYHSHAWYEQLVDLATALEATLSGTATTEVLLRLRGRAATLLSTDRDQAATIFDDIDHLYEIRSKLVHGGEISEKKLLNLLRAISTVPKDIRFGVALAHAVDRLRDLVRRSLLMRLCLASGDDPMWPISNGRSIDPMLMDDTLRKQWRSAWHQKLASFGAEAAADRPRVAVHALKDD